MRVEVGICPHMTILRASVFAWVLLCPVCLCMEMGPLRDCMIESLLLTWAILSCGHQQTEMGREGHR